ncbi:dolichyl-phosphate-mannose--protein mannosyltransferase [Actinocorallia sp. A-T 12471]|uniref:dolichyl-phosphate-mannose--protein mannosyltransferase n=1 Tax=Actinocorallia sp. A-T 12471 TaxID=3089813 RepID=UPI0029D20693|nr:phospholipid carrier-dependent glycosyltransferase [Actinocorallia sp. A-T 12471]MDX6738475.1 phospholipid carrier-dependent glycosyltransferase [Actinocorallia sp. A-T 12471]
MVVTQTRPVDELPTLRERLAPGLPGSRLWGWLLPLLVTAFAGFLRFNRLGVPHEIIFDEKYYAKDAWSLWQFGYEHSVVGEPEDLADKLFLEGSPHAMLTDGGAFIAHPPLGKWMIAVGEAIFGADPFGWRFSAALIGTLSVLILCRVARRMTGNTLLGCAAGFLLALDGLHLVTSRTALLDIFLMFWVLAGFACLVNDRDHARRRLADRIDRDFDASFSTGPFLGHPWRYAAGLCFGLAAGVKWSAAPFLVAFIVLVFIWDMTARRAAGVQFPYAGAALRDGVATVAGLMVLPVVAYVSTWSGWLLTKGGWGRGDDVASSVWLRPFEGLPNLVRYHKEVLNFHNNLSSSHPYQSWPWDWPILRKPVAFFYDDKMPGCGAEKCSREILGIGTPAIWWIGIAALAVMVVLWLTQRDWRAGAILLAYGAGWLSWFPSAFGDRTMFFFYALPGLPFLILAIVMTLGLIIGPENGPPRSRRIAGSVVAGAYLLVVLLNFWFMYPVFTAQNIPYDAWHLRMWLGSWI